MSLRTRRNASKPQIIKLDSVEDSSSKASGKPCIDFQPDDRWQIKEDNDNSLPEKSDSSSQKKKSKCKSSTAVNGESTAHNSDSENTSKNSPSVNDKKSTDSETEDNASKECNNSDPGVPSPKNSSAKRNCRVRKKRKNSSCDNRTNGKKAKSPPSNENSNDSVINCSSGEDGESEKSSAPKISNNIDETGSAPILENEKKVDSDDKTKDCPSTTSKKTKKEGKHAMPELSDSDDKEASKENKSVMPELSDSDGKDCSSKSEKVSKENQNMPDLSDELERPSTSEKTLKESEPMPELSHNEDSQSASTSKGGDSEKKDESMEISEIVIDDKEKTGGDSDNEIQIIGSTDEEKAKRKKLLNKKICESFTGDEKTSRDVLLSAGYPYFNSLAEKIDNFKAGVYNPVKFPHTGTLLLSDTEVIIESPSLLVPLLIKEADEFPKLEGDTSDSKQKPIYRKNFFQSSVGQFLINLGASRVLEWYYRDKKRMAVKQSRKSEKNMVQIIQECDQKYVEAKEANLAFNFRLRRCEFCDFKTESIIVMEAHYLIPHLSPRREFRCNFCTFMTRDPKDIAFHYEAIHTKKVLIEAQTVMHECLFCTFQSQLKSKVTVHMNRCRKNFIQTQNQSPPYDFEFPGVTTKPVSLADISGHRRMLLGSVKAQPGTFESFVQSAFAKKKLSSVLNLTGMENFPENPTLVKHLMGPHAKQTGFQLPPGIVLTRPRVRAQHMRQITQSLQPRTLPSLRPSAASMGYPNNIPSGISITPVSKSDPSKLISASSTGMKNLTLTPISSAGSQVVAKGGPPQPVALFTNVAGSDASRGRIAGMAPGTKMPMTMSGRGVRMVPPYQRLNTPPSQVVKNSSGNTFVMCEICDSYIKDLEELRSHMNWVHKVKIHPKMLVSRPPLNCQKCQWRFFTDQGLERHLLGAHGLVTTNMQEMANNNQDGGRCIICGAVFTYKLVSHMTQVHKVTLKPAHLSYKCTVCTATFTLYRLFESHVYNVHSGSAKRSSEEPSPAEPPAKKPATVDPPKEKIIVKESVKETVSRKCNDCGFITEFLEDHIKKKHMKECRIKVCRIDKCKKCLYSTDEMLVIRMSDIGSDEDSSSGSDDDSSDDSSVGVLLEEDCKTNDTKPVSPASIKVADESVTKSDKA